jgi:Mycothiol maleylpyruvate isomerase N-terminal domain
MSDPPDGAARAALDGAALDRLVADYLRRLAKVRVRLEEHLAAGVPVGLTDPDPGGTERWEARQVWAHLAEFPSYWLRQVRAILDEREAGEAEPIPFGRTKADPERIASIERDRRSDPAALLRRVTTGIADAEKALRALPTDAWRARGLHPTLGPMPLPRIVEEFIVGHLEEHADQLDLLRGR